MDGRTEEMEQAAGRTAPAETSFHRRLDKRGPDDYIGTIPRNAGGARPGGSGRRGAEPARNNMRALPVDGWTEASRQLHRAARHIERNAERLADDIEGIQHADMEDRVADLLEWAQSLQRMYETYRTEHGL